MIPALKEKKLSGRDHLNIIRRHIKINIVLALSLGILAIFTGTNIFLGGVTGFMLGVALSYLLEYLDCTLKTSEDVERCAKIPFLGYIPVAGEELSDKKDADLIAHYQRYSCVAEAFRKIKAELIADSSHEKPIKTLMVSSFIPKEGKTFVATNLAITLAADQEAVLLVDGDLRKGRLADIFTAGSNKGLTSALAGTSSWQDVVFSTVIPNLSLLPMGKLSSNPGELLNTGKLREILTEAGKKFEWIVIDSSPVLCVADPLILSNYCDGLVFVIKAGATPLKQIIDAQKRISGKVKVLGAVLNSVDADKIRSHN
ncbi:MAG: polysaccharide biosynthesis tyrosine autokinase [Candidatus Omnitrophota bacterium]